MMMMMIHSHIKDQRLIHILNVCQDKCVLSKNRLPHQNHKI